MTAITDFVLQFTLQGLMIIARNYLDVYPYDRWNAKVVIHCIFVFMTFPTRVLGYYTYIEN